MVRFAIYYNMYKLFDLHNDYFLKLKTDSKKQKYIKNSIVDAENIITALWTSELSNDESVREIERARDFVNSIPNLFLGVEDLHFLSKANLDKFVSLRPVYAGLTWNSSNCLAGGAKESGRLTTFGKFVVKKLESNNIKIDTAHLNEESFMDMSKISSKPLFCSHTAFFGLNPHLRNLKDYQIKMIVDSGGLVGLCLVSDFLTEDKQCQINHLVSHIDYFACKFGVNNIAIGTDFYGTNHLPKNAKNYSGLVKNVANALEKMGYTEKSISKIFFDNASEFFA